MTSPVVAIGRPRIEEVDAYVSQARAGLIAEEPDTRVLAALPTFALR